jgi:hypothetical protein
LDDDGNPLATWNPEDYAEFRKRLLNVNRGLNWFVDDGTLSKETIKSFLDKIEAMGEWNQSLTGKILDEFKPLAIAVDVDLKR